MAETLYKATNSPVKIGSTVIPRVQEFSIDTDRQSEPEYELGNFNPTGTSVGPWSYNGRMMFYPINTLVERAWIGQAASDGYVVKLADFMSATGVAITAPGMGLSDAVATALEYSVNVPNGKWSGSIEFRGTGVTGVTTVTAPAVAGVGSFRAKNIYARFETLAQNLLRIRSIRVRAAYTAEELFQLSSGDPFGVEKAQPVVSADIEWYWLTESVNPGTNANDLRPILEEASNVDLEVQVVPSGNSWGSVGNIRLVLANLTTTRRGVSVSIGQQGTHSISYTSGGDSSTYGLSINTIT